MLIINERNKFISSKYIIPHGDVASNDYHNEDDDDYHLHYLKQHQSNPSIHRFQGQWSKSSTILQWKLQETKHKVMFVFFYFLTDLK